MPTARKNPTCTGSGASSTSTRKSILELWEQSEVRAFLSHLAQQEHVSASTQNQALNALVFLYKQVIQKELGSIDAVRARRPKRLPVVLTRSEVEKILAFLSGTPAIMATLLYGSGLRLMECHRLRVKDIDFEQHQIIVRDGKGFKDRITVLPESVIPELTNHLRKINALHKEFSRRGYGEVELPYALERKYPTAKYERGWQYVFPAKSISTDPRSGARRRHHVHESTLQRAVKGGSTTCRNQPALRGGPPLQIPVQAFYGLGTHKHTQPNFTRLTS